MKNPKNKPGRDDPCGRPCFVIVNQKEWTPQSVHSFVYIEMSLFKITKGFAVNDMTGVDDLPIHCQHDCFGAVGAEEGVDQTAYQHLFSGGAHGCQLCVKGLVHIQFQTVAIDARIIDRYIIQ